MNFEDMKVNDFLTEIASKSPVPGGGSVSATVGAQAAALVCMVARLTIGKKKYEEVQEEIKEILGLSEKTMYKLQELAQKDADSYTGMVNARKEHGKDSAEYQEAVKNAIIIPLQTTRLCYRTFRMATMTEIIGNKNASSDIKVARSLAKNAVKGALLNVEINLPEVTDREFENKIKQSLECFSLIDCL